MAHLLRDSADLLIFEFRATSKGNDSCYENIFEKMN
jgi:hypothetical protein